MIVLAVETTIIIAAVVALLVGGGLGVVITRSALRKILLAKTELDIKELSEKAEVERKEKLLEAKEKFMQMKADHEKKCEDRKREIQRLESDLKNRQNQLNQRNEELQKNWAKRNDELQQEAVELKNREQELDQRHENLSKRQAELDRTQEEQTKLLEKISNLSSEEAKEQLKEIMRDEATAEAMILSKEIIEEAKMSANQTAKKIVLETIQRTAAEHAIENTVSVFNIENDEMKGRIIGREGRNIRALESLTGVEIIIDDSPDAILLSGFDPIRREIARLSLKKLVTDGRIHPARIEEVVRKVEKQIEQEIIETGKRTVIDMGIHNVAPELIKMIGRMKYRSSYGQNLLQHSTEVANLCATMAAELGLNPKAAKRAGLLHDIGKVAENDEELPHALLGMKTAERYKEKPEICNAIGAHHDEIEMETLIAPIVQVCDAISGARPGARREVVEAYIQRLNKLEEMALAFPGVVKTYAIQAGRELRVIVAADKVSDTEADRIAYDLSRQIQTEMTYPGQIKITVIRETRSISFAK